MSRREAEAEARATAGARSWIATCALAGAALALFALSWRTGFKGGVALTGAARVLAGDLPYRDFWTLYAPGHYYLLAALLAAFGHRVLVSTIAGSLLSACAVGLAHRLGLRLSGDGHVAVGVAAVLTAALFSTPFYRYLGTYPPLVCCVLLALLAFERALAGRERSTAWGAAAGVACGFAALFKHDVGAYTTVALAAGLAVHAALSAAEPRAALRLAATRIAALGIGAALPAGAGFLPLAWAAGPDLWHDLIVFPATDFAASRPESYPALWPAGLAPPDAPARRIALAWARWLTFALPFGLWCAGIALAVVASLRRDARSAALAVACSFAFGFHYAAAHVQINTHIVSMSLYAACLAALGLGLRAGTGRTRAGKTHALQAMAAALACVWVAALVARPAISRVDDLRRTGLRPYDTPALAGILGAASWTEKFAELVARVHDRVPPGQPIHVGPRRNDVAIIGDPMVYFLLDRPSATRYHEIHPAVTDTAPVQREMIDDLERQRVAVLILKDTFPDETLDRALARQRAANPAVGAMLLDDYVREHYEPAEQFGQYQIWVRRR